MQRTHWKYTQLLHKQVGFTDKDFTEDALEEDPFDFLNCLVHMQYYIITHIKQPLPFHHWVLPHLSPFIFKPQLSTQSNGIIDIVTLSVMGSDIDSSLSVFT